MDWKTRFPRQHRPRYEEVLEYLLPPVRPLFAAFNQTLEARYCFSNVQPTYIASTGWKYRYGRSGLMLVNDVRFHDGHFSVEGVDVTDENSLCLALAKVDALYSDGYPERFAVYAQQRAARVKARNAAREKTPPDPTLDRCKWPAMVRREQLRRLYAADARGLADEALLEEIGVTLYVRCATAKDIYERMERGHILCTQCGRDLAGKEGVMECPCGQRYTYRGYRRSYRTNNMPRGAASAIFDAYIEAWPRAKSPADKMRLIDGLIHELHVSDVNGTPNRPVGVNLIAGTKAQVSALLDELAYGDTRQTGDAAR